MDVIRRTLLFAAFYGLVMCAWATDTGPGSIEEQIKATYLYKFASYVEWPSATFAQAGTPLTIGVVGADDIATALTGLIGGSTMNNRALAVKILKPNEPLTGVQILFIGRQENGQLKRLLDNVQSQPVLTVTESAGALDAGSIINFVPVDQHIRFEVSVAQAERNGLKISARLLNVAQKIETRGP